MHARTQSPAQALANSTAPRVISNATQLNEAAELLVPMLKKSVLETFPTSTLMQLRLMK